MFLLLSFFLVSFQLHKNQRCSSQSQQTPSPQPLLQNTAECRMFTTTTLEYYYRKHKQIQMAHLSTHLKKLTCTHNCCYVTFRKQYCLITHISIKTKELEDGSKHPTESLMFKYSTASSRGCLQA